MLALVASAALLSLEEIGAKWITTCRNGVALKNINASYVDRTLETTIDRSNGYGVTLEELWAGPNGRGLVLVSGVDGAALGKLEVGDTIKAVDDVDVEGSDFDATIAALRGAGNPARVTVQRLEPRRAVDVTVLDPGGDVRASFPLPAGGNLRLGLLFNGLRDSEIYDSETMRFDAIANSGTNCGGEGTCGTCLVAVVEGADRLIPPARVEKAALLKQRRPPRWRWSCRCNVGLDNRGGGLTVMLRPQANFKDEQTKITGT
ncbi:hypothetical protein CTAYLR_003714 [Chrysophaeum taylorii]|uniref:PDZ domain-containing protein n=1 Tax=Chrysophaeum taylorii TaxID=2483200 RepID=A0AAD7UNV5_9STRA|nr:hypothetical protein CTAYLR_003714 [Chrysophaeum taylorii]